MIKQLSLPKEKNQTSENKIKYFVLSLKSHLELFKVVDPPHCPTKNPPKTQIPCKLSGLGKPRGKLYILSIAHSQLAQTNEEVETVLESANLVHRKYLTNTHLTENI